MPCMQEERTQGTRAMQREIWKWPTEDLSASWRDMGVTNIKKRVTRVSSHGMCEVHTSSMWFQLSSDNYIHSFIHPSIHSFMKHLLSI